MTTTDDPVLGDHDTGDGAEEYGVGREVGSKAVRILQELPWTHDQSNNGCDIASAADILYSNQTWFWREGWEDTHNESREKCREIATCRDRVGGDVGAELSQDKAGRDEPDAETGGTTGPISISVIIKEPR